MYLSGLFCFLMGLVALSMVSGFPAADIIGRPDEVISLSNSKAEAFGINVDLDENGIHIETDEEKQRRIILYIAGVGVIIVAIVVVIFLLRGLCDCCGALFRCLGDMCREPRPVQRVVTTQVPVNVLYPNIQSEIGYTGLETAPQNIPPAYKK